MATVSLADLRTRVRERADMVNSSFVSDAELGRFITASAQELHGLLAQKFSDDYVVSTQTIITVAGTSAYNLATDFFKLLAVDFHEGGFVHDLKRYDVKERNFHRNNIFSPNLSLPRYRVQGSQLLLLPAPSGVYTVTVHYIPELALTSGVITQTTFPNGWEEYVVVDAAIKCLDKEESDTRAHRADLQRILNSINEAAQNRDAGAPPRVIDLDAAEVDPLVDLW